MLENGAVHLLQLIEAELDKRSPGWKNPRGFGRPQPTHVRFQNDSFQLPSQIEAYIYLIEKFIELRSDFLRRKDILSQIAVTGRAGHFFAQTPSELWLDSPHLADEGYYRQLSNGWYASTNLSLDQKCSVLARFAAFAEISRDQWSFTPVES